MALSKDDILNAIAEMSVMDIVSLIEAMEQKFVSEIHQRDIIIQMDIRSKKSSIRNWMICSKFSRSSCKKKRKILSTCSEWHSTSV